MEKLKQLRNEIIEEQFSSFDEYNQENLAEDVLSSIANIRANPKLLRYVLACLSENNIQFTKQSLFVIEVKYPIYDTNKNSEIYKARMAANDPKYVLKITLPKVFNSFEEAEEYTKDRSNFGDERILFDTNAVMYGLKMSDLLFEKFSIVSVN